MNSHFSKLELSCEQYICTVLLKAPPLNIITRQVLDELEEALRLLEQENELRVVVVSSALPNIFCAGADIKAFASWTGESGRAACLHGSNVFRGSRGFPGRSSARSAEMPSAPVWNWRWPATSAFSMRTPRCLCPSAHWGCSPAMAGPSGLPG